jgi:hypothetical protein
MWQQLLLQFAVSAGSSILANKAKNSSEEEARAILQAAQDEFGKVDIPTLEQLAADQLGPSALEGYTPDPKLQQAQLRALDKLQEVGDGGMTMQDQAVLNAAMGKVARTEGAGRNAIKGDMEARGTLGSGAELAMSMANNQAASERAHQTGLDVAGRAQQRALEAIMQRGGLAGQMRGQNFSEQERIAAAKDAIAKFNAVRRPDAAKTRAQLQLARAQGMAGMAPGIARTQTNQGQNDAAMIGGLGSAGNQAIGAHANYQNTAPTAATAPAVKSDDEILREAEEYDYA